MSTRFLQPATLLSINAHRQTSHDPAAARVDRETANPVEHPHLFSFCRSSVGNNFHQKRGFSGSSRHRHRALAILRERKKFEGAPPSRSMKFHSRRRRLGSDDYSITLPTTSAADWIDEPRELSGSIAGQPVSTPLSWPHASLGLMHTVPAAAAKPGNASGPALFPS